jgi:hypothetical protein
MIFDAIDDVVLMKRRPNGPRSSRTSSTSSTAQLPVTSPRLSAKDLAALRLENRYRRRSGWADFRILEAPS